MTLVKMEITCEKPDENYAKCIEEVKRRVNLIFKAAAEYGPYHHASQGINFASAIGWRLIQPLLRRHPHQNRG